MASIKYGAIASEIKGKVGGSVFQSSKAGFSIKNKPSGNFTNRGTLNYADPSTSYTWFGCDALGIGAVAGIVYPDGSFVGISDQRTQQNNLSMMSASWRDLTSDQRNAWQAAATSFPFRNRFGDLYTASGFQVFMQLNLNLITVQVPMLLYPPTPALPLLPRVEILDPATYGPLALRFPAGINVGLFFIVTATCSRSAGRASGNLQKKIIAIIQPCGAGQIVYCQYAWQALYGLFQPNTVIVINFSVMNDSTGQVAS